MKVMNETIQYPQTKKGEGLRGLLGIQNFYDGIYFVWS